jgi:hypothetical protein
MKKVSLLFILVTFLVTCKKEELNVHPSLIGTWQVYMVNTSVNRLFSIDKNSISFFEYDNFSTNYEIINYSQIGTTYPIDVSLICKSKSKFNKGFIKEFNFKLYSEDTLKYTEYGPNFWYYKL